MSISSITMDVDPDEECDHPDEYHAAKWDDNLGKYWIICTLCNSKIALVNELSDFLALEKEIL